MALTTKQRNALPDNAFAYPKKRKYPVPTKAQAKKVGHQREAAPGDPPQRAVPSLAEGHRRHLQHRAQEGAEAIRRQQREEGEGDQELIG